MKSKPRTAIEKEWHDLVSLMGMETSWLRKTFGQHVKRPYQFNLQHMLGSQAKRKVNGASVKVGEFAVFPVPIEIHSVELGEYENHPLNLTRRKKAFEAEFGTEKELFLSFIEELRKNDVPLPFGDDVIEAIVR